MEKPDWPRVRIPCPTCPPGASIEEADQALLAVCWPLWTAGKIPVVGWGEFAGTELLPPIKQ